jgi:hypothetical protein
VPQAQRRTYRASVSTPTGDDRAEPGASPGRGPGLQVHAALRLDRDRPVALAIGRLTVMKGQRAGARSGPSAQEF